MFDFVRTHLRGAALAVWGFTALLLGACGGGGTTSSGPPPTGAAVMTLTDAKGDFLSYIVTLTSLQLETASGTSVETIPTTTKVDFAQLVDLTEVLSAGQIPAADYVSAKLTIDYTNANITADDGTGKAIPLKPVDANGNALTGTLTLTVTLDNANHLVITPERTARLALDFNLAASNAVNLTANTVSVTPTLAATVVPADDKQIRVRGSLVSASTAQNDFVVDVKPFHVLSTTAGQVTAQVTATTTYEINGTAYTGTAGITALAALPAGAMVAAFGTLTTATTPTFTATEVLAGTSLENDAEDQIAGTVIARSGDSLTVRGATWSKRDGDFDFEVSDVTVAVGPKTAVVKEGLTTAATTTDISVGQIIAASGIAHQASTASIGSTELLALDATAGSVRLEVTPAWGTVTAMTAGSLTLNLQMLGGLPSDVLNFAGTGTASTNDTKATAYVVDTGTLSQTGIATSASARVLGFVTPFGMAPPDFRAQTLVNFAGVTEALVVTWGSMGSGGIGSTMALTDVTAASTALTLNLANVGAGHFIQAGPQQIDITTLAAAPTIVPNATGTNDVFTIGHAGTHAADNFNTFGGFVAKLAADLNGTTAVIAVTAVGTYDKVKSTFTATGITVLLSN